MPTLDALVLPAPSGHNGTDVRQRYFLAVLIKGKWLREAGFETGTQVTVNIAGDCIVLRPEIS